MTGPLPEAADGAGGGEGDFFRVSVQNLGKQQLSSVHHENGHDQTSGSIVICGVVVRYIDVTGAEAVCVIDD